MEPPRKKPRPLGGPPHLSASLGASKDFRKKTGNSSNSANSEVDASIFDYDSYHDAKESLSKASPSSTSKDGKEGGPQYMSSIRAATSQRKMDQLAARDRILQREREAEGDTFADKEKFVTEAYKAQQAEARQAEQAEKERERKEEEERKRRGGGGMGGFYREYLGEEEERHRMLVDAALNQKKQTAKESGTELKPEKEKEKTDLDRAKELNSAGGHVIINDSGEVADKRQLLKGGLNVVSKKKPPLSASSSSAAGHRAAAAQSQSGFNGFRGGSEQARRHRQTAMLEQQLEESARQAAEQEEAERKVAEEKAQSKKSKDEVSGARERYLQRKREAAAAAAATAGARSEDKG